MYEYKQYVLSILLSMSATITMHVFYLLFFFYFSFFISFLLFQLHISHNIHLYKYVYIYTQKRGIYYLYDFLLIKWIFSLRHKCIDILISLQFNLYTTIENDSCCCCKQRITIAHLNNGNERNRKQNDRQTALTFWFILNIFIRLIFNFFFLLS